MLPTVFPVTMMSKKDAVVKLHVDKAGTNVVDVHALASRWLTSTGQSIGRSIIFVCTRSQ